VFGGIPRGCRLGGFVLLRLRAHRLLVAAALLTVLLTTAVLASLAGFTSAVGDAGVRRALQSGDAARTPLLLQDDAGYGDRTAADAVARTLSARAFPGMPVSVRSLALSDPFTLPAASLAAPGTAVDGTTLAPLDHAKVRLLSGTWPGTAPAGGTGAVPVAVPLAAAVRLGRGGAAVRPGAVVDLTDLLTHRPLDIRVTGIYTALDSGDTYWQLDPLAGKGAQLNVSGSSYGPLLVADGDFADGAVPQYSMTWQATAGFGTLRASGLGALAASVTGVLTTVGAQSTPAFAGFSATSALPALVPQLQQTLLVARSTLLVVVLQLVLLALMTLLLSARLLTEERESENALLRARGAAPRRLTALAAAEALLLVLPAAVLSPLLAGPLIRLISSYGPLAASGVRLDGPLPDAVRWAAGVGALSSALVILAPTLVRARSWSEHRQQRARRAALPGLLRGGADLALVALAAAACWQLDHDASAGGGSGALNTDSHGQLGIDPVLVAAPALALAAGAVLTLRLLPLIARFADRVSARARGLPAALVGWQLSRRPQQGTGPILVLALAAAIGTLALGQSTSWHRSQVDQAAFDTGADIRVTDADGTAFGQAGPFGSLPGVTAAVPVARQSLGLAGGGTAELLALDTRAEAGLLDWRPDIRDGRSVASLLGPLPDPAPTVAQQGIPLPGRPDAVSLDLSAELTGGAARSALMTYPYDELTLTVTDRYHIPYSLPLLEVPTDGATHTLSVQLAAPTGGGVPAYPLTITSMSIVLPVSTAGPVRQEFTVHAIRADGTAVTVPSGFAWSPAFDAGQPVLAQPASGPPVDVYRPGRVLTDAADQAAPLTATLDSGTVGASNGFVDSAPPTGTATFTSLRPDGPGGALPAVVDRRFLDSTGSHVGSVVPLYAAAGGVDIRVTAVVSEIPGTGPGTVAAGAAADGAVLVDLAAYDRRAAATVDDYQLQPTEWWLYTGSDGGGGAAAAEDRVAAALRAIPGVESVSALDQVRTSLTEDPIGTGPEAALLAAVVLAVVLASIAFSADATAIVRRRADEVAVLRALGAPTRLTARSIAAQLALPALIGIGVGLSLGEVLARLVVPLLVLTPQATRPVPPALVEIPGGPLCLLLVAVAAVPLLVAALSGLRSGNPAQRLRQPEES